MSAKATFWAWAQNIKQGQKLVLLAIADSANDDGECWPGYGELKRKTGITSDATISRHIKDLTEAGLLKVINRRGMRDGQPSQYSNLYLLPVTSKIEDTVTSKNEVAMTSNFKVAMTSKIEDESNKESNKESKSIYRKLDITGLPECITEFVDHRCNLKKPLTQEALNRFVRAAHDAGDELGLPFNAVVQEVIDAGWQGVKAHWLRNRMGDRGGGKVGTRHRALSEDLNDKSWAH